MYSALSVKALRIDFVLMDLTVGYQVDNHMTVSK